MWLRSFCVGSIFFGAFNAFGIDLQAKKDQAQNSLAFSAEISRLVLEKGQLQATGVRADFQHSLSKKWNIEVFLTSAFEGENGVSSTYTGFGGMVYYSIFGNCCPYETRVGINGSSVLHEKEELQQFFEVGAGLNQYLLNGSEGVYSSSGVGLGANYFFPAFGQRFKISGRFSEMVSGSLKVQGTFLSFGMVFQL